MASATLIHSSAKGNMKRIISGASEELTPGGVVGAWSPSRSRKHGWVSLPRCPLNLPESLLICKAHVSFSYTFQRGRGRKCGSFTAAIFDRIPRRFLKPSSRSSSLPLFLLTAPSIKSTDPPPHSAGHLQPSSPPSRLTF